MADLKLTKNKHLTLDDREEIVGCLNKGMTYKAIARRIGKDPTTISKEVKKHLIATKPGEGSRKIDNPLLDGRGCSRLLKAPFVCNPCEKKHGNCSFRKQFYNARSAHSEYETLLRESREGIPLNKDEFWEADATIKKYMKQGQRLYHIMESQDIVFSKSTAYRHLHRGYLSVSKLDFPRVVKFKARKQHRVDSVPNGVRVGRTYGDFQAFIKEHGITSWVEMDTVVGREGGKVIMTFDFTRDNFMFGLLLDDKTAAEATSRVHALKSALNAGGVRFGDIIPLLLTDNGGEFSNISAFINDLVGVAETDLFFCDPYRSSQKPKVEKNHTIFRDIIPKGKSFDNFTQGMVNLIFSHINGVKRKSLNGKSPYEAFTFLYGGKIAELLGIVEITADLVIQSPKLLASISKTPASPQRADGDAVVR